MTAAIVSTLVNLVNDELDARGLLVHREWVRRCLAMSCSTDALRGEEVVLPAAETWRFAYRNVTSARSIGKLKANSCGWTLIKLPSSPR
jgi:hypothetical protein